MQSIPTTQILEALMCPRLAHIRAPGLEFANGAFSPILSTGLLSRIADSCPKIQELSVYPSNIRFAAPHAGVSTIPGPSPSPNCLTPLAQLNNLRTIDAGPEALSPGLLDMLGALPNLESFVVYAPPDTPGQVFPTQLPASASGFPTLRHLGFFHGSPFRITQSWKVLPCVQMLTAVTIKTDSGLVTNDNDLRDLICAICQFSPKVTELHLDLSPDLDSLFDIQLLTPTVVSHLSHLPLQRLRIRTRGVQLLPPEEYKQLALALPDVEYLDLQECYFTYQGIEYLAKFNRRLQFLCVNLHLRSWPSKDELPASPVFSSSILCLRSNYTTDTSFWDVSRDTKKGFIDSLSTGLHRLWPNGVHCVFSEHAAGSCDIEAREEEDLESINFAINRLCTPETFDAPDIRSASQWQYANYGLMLRLGLGSL